MQRREFVGEGAETFYVRSAILRIGSLEERIECVRNAKTVAGTKVPATAQF